MCTHEIQDLSKTDSAANLPGLVITCSSSPNGPANSSCSILSYR